MREKDQFFQSRTSQKLYLHYLATVYFMEFLRRSPPHFLAKKSDSGQLYDVAWLDLSFNNTIAPYWSF